MPRTAGYGRHTPASRTFFRMSCTARGRRLQTPCALAMIGPMGIIDDLLTNPGLYVGTDRVMDADRVGAARILLTPLPGQSGVALDYEIFNPSAPERLHGHVEHTMIGRSHEGPNLMVISDMHAPSIAVLHETEPGVFELCGEPSAYPMKVVISVPEPGRLHHAWWFGPPGDDAVERVVAELARAD